MSTAIYYTTLERGVKLNVAAKNAGGTVELVNDQKQLVVGKCPVSTEPKAGHCVLEAAPAPKEDPKEDPKKDPKKDPPK